LEQIISLKSEKSQPPFIEEWGILSVELQNCGIAETLIEEEYFFINDWLKAYLQSEPERAALAEEEDDLPPGYIAGPQRQTIAEKVQSLDDTSKIMAIESPVMPAGTSSAAEPPPYTFEEGSDQNEDEEFSRYIQKAIQKEASNRYLERQETPNRGPTAILGFRTISKQTTRIGVISFHF
jgi:hypothetical protein